MATGVFFTVKPAGKVMVGLPLMSNGAVNLIKRANSAGTVPMTDISWVVGDAMGCAGINSKSQFWKNPRTAPVKARRRNQIFCISTALMDRPNSINPPRPGP